MMCLGRGVWRGVFDFAGSSARVPSDDTGRGEYALATARSFLVTASLVAIYLDPTEPARYASVAYTLLGTYAVFAFIVMAVVRVRPAWVAPVVLHGVDLGFAALLTLFTTGPNSSFFVFVLLAAAYRWGLRETLMTAGAAFLLLIADAGLVTLWSEPDAVVGGAFGLNLYVMRGAYLVVLGAVAGYLAETEKQTRVEAEAIARAHLARELHDGLVQSLIALDMQVDQLRRKPQLESEGLSEELADIQLRLRGQITSVRGLMLQMTPLTISPDRLLEFLVELVDRFRRETGIAARFFSDLDEIALPPRVCREIAGIVQEALANIRKHSGARSAQVRLTCKDGHLKLAIADDGRGLDFEGGLTVDVGGDCRRGPRVIRERALAIGGRVVVKSKRGRGVHLEVDIQRAYPWTPAPKRSVS